MMSQSFVCSRCSGIYLWSSCERISTGLGTTSSHAEQINLPYYNENVPLLQVLDFWPRYPFMSRAASNHLQAKSWLH